MAIMPTADAGTATILLGGHADGSVTLVIDSGGIATVTESGGTVPIAGYQPPFAVTDAAVVDSLGNTQPFNLVGNAAQNRLSGAAGGDTLDGGDGVDTLAGNAGDDTMLGGKGADTLLGGDGGDTLDGGRGNDVLRGGDGDDVYFLDDFLDAAIESRDGGHDTVRSAVQTTLRAHVEDLVIIGSTGLTGTGNNEANKLTGGQGDDALLGAGGGDVLDGRAGADEMTGGSGRDKFVLGVDHVEGDRITDFKGAGPANVDTILFRGFGAGATLSYEAATDRWLVGDASGHAEHFTITGVTSLDASDYSFA